MNQISMCSMDLKKVETNSIGTLRCLRVTINLFDDRILIERDWRVTTWVGNGRRTIDCPTALFLAQRPLAFPSNGERAFAAGVPELHTEFGAAIFPAESNRWF